MCFIGGCVAGSTVLLLRPWIDSLLPPNVDAWTDAFLLTAGVEETCKLLVFIGLAYRHREFDEPLDGIIYAIAVALGFASFENYHYVELYDSARLAFERAFTSMLGHVAFTGSIGYFFGHARFATRRKAWWMFAGIAAGVIEHGSYDLLLDRGRTAEALLLVLPISLILLGLKIRWHRRRSSDFHG